ncbi:MAG: peptidoglycan DD-metalloendopeptidase family protein [Candidatus Ozemobacteraceae bacterium]
MSPFRFPNTRINAWLALLPAIFFAIFLAMTTSNVAVAAGSDSAKLSKLQDELGTLRVQMDYLDLKVRDSRAHIKKLEEKVAQSEKRVSDLQARLDTIGSETASIDGNVLELNSEISRARAQADSVMTRFRARLVQLHKIRQGTLLSTVFSANDLNTFLNRYQMVRYLLQHDRGLLTDLAASHDRLDTAAKALETKRSRLDELAAQTRKNREELVVESTGLSAMLQTLLLERKLFIARQDKLKKSYASLESEIDKIETGRSADPEALDRELNNSFPPSAPQPPEPAVKGQTGTRTGTQTGTGKSPRVPPNRPPGGLVVAPTPAPMGVGIPRPPAAVIPERAPAPIPSAIRAVTAKIRFRWPLKQIGNLGFRQDAGVMPTTLEMLVKSDADVFAVERGKVLFKGPMGQLGNVVIIGHHQGFSSVYGRLDEMWVGIGQIIEAGDPVGHITLNGESRLHFEIRLGGRAMNPLTLLPKLP